MATSVPRWDPKRPRAAPDLRDSLPRAAGRGAPLGRQDNSRSEVSDQIGDITGENPVAPATWPRRTQRDCPDWRRVALEPHTTLYHFIYFMLSSGHRLRSCLGCPGVRCMAYRASIFDAPILLRQALQHRFRRRGISRRAIEEVEDHPLVERF